MKDFIVITAFRDTGDPYRRRNLAACIGSVSRNFPEADHVVAVQGGTVPGDFPGVSVLHVRDIPADGLFHKPMLLNSAVESFQGRKLYVMVDADVYLERSLAGYAMTEGGEGRLVFPYGDTVYMDEMDTRRLLSGKGLWPGEKDHGVTIRRQTGLTVAFTYNDFMSVRGFDREFAGWGAEDDAFMYKFIRSGRRVVRNPSREAVAYHMFHPKVNTREYTSGVVYRKNRVYCACVRRMSDADFAGYLRGESGLDPLVAKYRGLGRLEVSLDWPIVRKDLAAGVKDDVVLHMDTTIYDIPRDRGMSIDLVLSAVEREDGPEGVAEFIDGVLGKIPGLPGNVREDIGRWRARCTGS